MFDADKIQKWVRPGVKGRTIARCARKTGKHALQTLPLKTRKRTVPRNTPRNPDHSRGRNS